MTVDFVIPPSLDEEEDRIIEQIKKADKRYDHLRDMVKIALNTGIRQGEIFVAKKDWINLKEGLIIVPRHSQKRKKKEKKVPKYLSESHQNPQQAKLMTPKTLRAHSSAG